MPDLETMAVKGVEKIAQTFEDPESHAAGSADPSYEVSSAVRVSRQGLLYVYHLDDTHLGQGASFGNAACWAETKGTGLMLSLFGIREGKSLLGGLSVNYLMPFADLSLLGRPARFGGQDRAKLEHEGDVGGEIVRAAPIHRGQIHLHPCYQQRDFDIGDGLRILETFFVPRRGMDDPPTACCTVALTNHTQRPIGITLAASLDLRGHTDRNMRAEYHSGHHALLAWNEDQPDLVRYFAANHKPDHYVATSAQEDAYNPRHSMPDNVETTGDLIGALQFDLMLMPGQQRKLRLAAGWSCEGKKKAMSTGYDVANDSDALADTIKYYTTMLDRAELHMPDDILNQGVQWSKANMLRPLASYAEGTSVTNDPGNSTHLVGRDIAWYVHGCDYLMPEACCDSLRIFAEHQREDGLIAEWIDGNSGYAEFHDFNINDNTPLFVVAVVHHTTVSGHEECLDALYEPARKAVELILTQINDRGLVSCTADGMGAKGIASWRNVLDNEQINGEVTEVNAECCDALRRFADLARQRGHGTDADRYLDAHRKLKDAINDKLCDPSTNLYVRNIDLDGRVFNQATVDMVFPLMFHVADQEQIDAVSARLFSPDIMTSGGVRTISEQNPRWNPSSASGLLGGVWPGATWWFAMGCSGGYPGLTADSLKRSYEYLVRDPKTFNTVPGQFNEWSDGQTLVNRGMRLSPWAPPRFFWAAVEGLAGVRISENRISMNPRLPRDWRWMFLSKLPVRGQEIEALAVHVGDEWHLYTDDERLETDMKRHVFARCEPDAAEALTTGMVTCTFRSDGETLMFFGSARNQMLVAPILTHDVLDTDTTYRVHRFSSIENCWQDIGRHRGKHLHRIAVRIEPSGFDLYRFVEDEA